MLITNKPEFFFLLLLILLFSHIKELPPVSLTLTLQHSKDVFDFKIVKVRCTSKQKNVTGHYFMKRLSDKTGTFSE